jgi:hypothetical protein
MVFGSWRFGPETTSLLLSLTCWHENKERSNVLKARTDFSIKLIIANFPPEVWTIITQFLKNVMILAPELSYVCDLRERVRQGDLSMLVNTLK